MDLGEHGRGVTTFNSQLPTPNSQTNGRQESWVPLGVGLVGHWRLSLPERLTQIVDQVLRIFDTRRNSHQAVGQADRGA